MLGKRMESVKAVTWKWGVCLEAEEKRGDSQYDEAGRQRDQQAKAVLTRSRIPSSCLVRKGEMRR